MTDHLIVVGRLAAPYGVRGWVKLRSFTEPADAIFEYQFWQLQMLSDEWQPLKLVDYRSHGQGYVVQLDGCIDRNQAQTYQGRLIGVDANQLSQLEAGNYYWRDLVGLSVWTLQNQWLGVVDHLLETGANDVLVLRPVEGSLDQKERLIPYLRDRVILHVNLAERKMIVDWDSDF